MTKEEQEKAKRWLKCFHEAALKKGMVDESEPMPRLESLGYDDLQMTHMLILASELFAAGDA